MKKPRALVVDDEIQMVSIVAYALETQGFEVIQAYDGREALKKFDEEKPDLVILDVMLPGMDGFEVCQQIRGTALTPVILLTARKEDEDIIHGLELGADDYITKPFRPRELALRAQAIYRRTCGGMNSQSISIGKLKIDQVAHKATMNEDQLHLTPNEFSLLVCLVCNAGRVLTWQSLLKNAWGLEIWEGGREMVKMAVYRLRQKMGDNPEDPEFILTVRGVGYTMIAHDEK
jgi:DNA-binding response OmpR family regulator